MVVHVKTVGGVGFGERSMALDDTHVLVVVVGRAIAEVVTASDDDAIGAEGIDDDDLVVNDGVTCLEEFFFPNTESVLNTDGGNHTVVRQGDGFLPFCGCIRRRRMLAGGAGDDGLEGSCGAGVGDRTADEEIAVGLLSVGDGVNDARAARLEREEKDGVDSTGDEREDFVHVGRGSFGFSVLGF